MSVAGGLRAALRLALLAAGVLALTLILVVAAHVALHGRTPPVLDASNHVVPGGIASLEWIPLGGEPQSVLIRGRSPANPVVLFLHGGPGMPAMYLAHAWQRPLEEDFVVVQWDRRGAGKSYEAGLAPDRLTVRRLLEDTYALVDTLRQRFGQERIILVGHSWGSYLGMLAVRERPELFRAFIGVGQVTGAGRGDSVARGLQEAFIRAEAERRGRPEAVRDLEARGAAAIERWVFAFGGELAGATSWWPLLRLGLRAPEYTLRDVRRIPQGLALYAERLRFDVAADTLRANVTEVRVPVAFVAGRRDYATPSALVAAYYEALRAPWKALVWFERSAHFPFLEEPQRFASVVRMVATETAAPPR